MDFVGFKQLIWDFHKENRRNLPWRNTWDPYHIVVSEIMLQQTQVNRVAQKYPEFIQKFSTFKALAEASNIEVLALWSGMGYNRRALYLKKIAEIVTDTYKGELPNEPKLLQELPGIGYATSNSIATFAFNYPGIFIETNIRRVFIHSFFKDKEQVDDKDIYPLIEETVDKENPREWYYALMDYGSQLPKLVTNPNRKSKHYTIQSQFEGSNRQMRGMILKELVQYGSLSEDVFIGRGLDKDKVQKNLAELQKEGFIMEEKGVYKIK